MNNDSRWKQARLWLAVVLLICVASPALAQEADADADAEPEEESRIGRLFVEIGTWIAQPVGLDYRPATVRNPNDPFDVQTIPVRYGTDTRGRYRVGYELPAKIGTLTFSYYSHNDEAPFRAVSPGQYVFGQTLVHPFHAGLNDDGLADGFAAQTKTQLRDVRVDFSRTAFDNTRARGEWFFGVRRVFHRREQEASYFSIVSGLPPLIPPISNPRPDLVPGTDLAELTSKYEGRGVEAGLDVSFPIWSDKLAVEAGLAVAALRGSTDSAYTSVTHFYAVVDSLGEVQQILAPPYSEFGQLDPGTGVPLADSIVQFQSAIGLTANRISTNGTAVDTFLGLRWRAWRGVEVVGGFRTTYYDNAGVDLRPRIVSVSSNGEINLQDVSEVKRSAGYEGFYFGIGYRQ